MFEFIESEDAELALRYSFEDPNTPFPVLWHTGAVGQCLFIIRQGGEDVGWALFVRVFNDFEVFKFFIRPSFRDRGVGTSAATALVQFLRANDFQTFAITASDDRAERMWERALAPIPHQRFFNDKFLVGEDE